MPKGQSNLKSALIPEISALLSRVGNKFVAIPATNCECGKPVVFENKSKKFSCSRCGVKWVLTVQVSKVE